MDKQSMAAWTCQDSSLHADCRVYKILREHWTNPQQEAAADFYVMDVNDWALTIALTDHGNCVVIRQFRFGVGDFTWELPAGVVDPGEDPLEGGLRELYEETGYQTRSARVLSIVHPNPAIQRNRCHIILAEGAHRTGEGDPGPHEEFEVREISINDLFGWAKSGKISHSIVHSALFYLREHLDKSE